MDTYRVDDNDSDFMRVAQAFLDERERREGDALRRYAERYPAYAPDLMLLATDMALAEGTERTGADATATAQPPVHLLARLRADARAALLPSMERAPISSLIARARASAGLTPRALARRLGVGVDVVALLDEGHVRADTIAARFIERLAEALDSSAEAVSAYLAAPGGKAAVAYHAPQGHTPARTLTFAEAIAESPLTTPDQKDYWMAENRHQTSDVRHQILEGE